jgi:hypothetical protein
MAYLSIDWTKKLNYVIVDQNKQLKMKIGNYLK